MDERTRTGDLRVVLDARVWDRASGGVQQWVLGLAAAFSALEPSGDEYLFLVEPERHEWLVPFISGSCRIVTTSSSAQHHTPLSAVRGWLSPRVPGARAAWRRLMRSRTSPTAIPQSDGTVERLEADVVHFTFQDAFSTLIPSIYQPWDLQHLHLPEFFSDHERVRRDTSYRTFCGQAEAIVVASRWVKRDLVDRYGIRADRIAVVNVPPVTASYQEPSELDLDELRARLGLPDRFLFYPAQTWPHKNHIRLIQALGRLRASGLHVKVVCTGERNDHYATILRAARDAAVDDDVSFVGFLPPNELACLYLMADGLVFPSIFEGWGMPVVEAFRAGLPVACSNVTSMPDLVGDAALVFDPFDVAAIADSIRRLWTDEGLRSRLGERGRHRSTSFSWPTTALTLRAHYRRVAGRSLDDRDRALLEAESLV